jgi:trimeric autotransporter adhesin
VTFTGTHASDFSLTSAPATSIAAGSSTTFKVVFSPTTLTTETATLTVTADEAAYTVTVSGTGTASGTLQAEFDGDGYLSLSNGDTVSMPSLYGSGTSSMSFRLTDTSTTGSLVLVGATPSITNDTGAFAITTMPVSPLTANGGSTIFVIEMSWIGAGTYSETVTLKTSDASNQTFTFTVSGGQYLP